MSKRIYLFRIRTRYLVKSRWHVFYTHWHKRPEDAWLENDETLHAINALESQSSIQSREVIEL